MVSGGLSLQSASFSSLFVCYIFIDVDSPVEKINKHLPDQIRVIGELAMVSLNSCFC